MTTKKETLQEKMKKKEDTKGEDTRGDKKDIKKEDKKDIKKEGKKEEMVELHQKIGELTDMLQRLQADFQNYRKQVERDREKQCLLSKRNIISDLLPLLDSFELALKSKDKNIDKDFQKGVELIFSQLFSILEKQGVKRIDCIGKRFDPNYHEVLLSEEGEEDEIVLEEFQKGYMLGEMVIRHSKVKISKTKEAEGQR